MKNPELFDVIELLIDLPAHNLSAGDSRSETLRERGAICEEYGNSQYEVEFTNSDGESIALVALSIDSFVIVWRSASKTWVPIAEKIQAIVSTLQKRTYQKFLISPVLFITKEFLFKDRVFNDLVHLVSHLNN